jgi:hypothetical protein
MSIDYDWDAEMLGCWDAEMRGCGDAGIKRRERVVRHWKAGGFHPRKFYWGWMPPHPTFFVRRRVYEKYGLFNLDLGTAADYELMLRFLLKHRISTVYIPEVPVKMRVGGGRVTRALRQESRPIGWIGRRGG